MYEDFPDMDFTPEGRKREYFIIREAKKAIRNLDNISEEEKIKKSRELDEHLVDYELLYIKHSEEQFFKELQDNLKEKDILKNDGESINSWKRYCIKKDFKRLEKLN
jgi:hypothetical protein